MVGKKGETLIRTYNRVYLYTFVIVILSMTLTQNYLIKPLLKGMQRKEDIENLYKIKSVVTSKLHFINSIIADNAQWKAMANAIEEKDMDFIKGGYDESFIKSIGGNHISLYDQNIVEIYNLYLEDIDRDHVNQIREKILNNYDKSTYNLSGLANVDNENYYYTISKVTNGKDSELKGILIFIKKIDAPFVGAVSKELYDKIEIVSKNYELDSLEEVEVKRRSDIKRLYYIGVLKERNREKNEYLLRYSYNNLGKDDRINLKVTLENNNEAYINIFNFRVKVMVVIFLVVILILNYMLKKNIIDPVANLSEKMNRFLTNQDNYLVNGEKKEDEISILMSNYDTLIHMIGEREKKLKGILYLDSLTGVGTRRVLDEKLEEFFDGAKEKQELAMGMIDIDCFKRYNDNYGHQKGDEVLKRFGELLIETFDIEKDLIIRYGGEEFIVVSKPSEEEEFENKIIKLKDKIKEDGIEHNYSLDKEKIISFSCGVVKGIPKAGDTSQVFIKRADEKLYTAKAKGRNRIVF